MVPAFTWLLFAPLLVPPQPTQIVPPANPVIELRGKARSERKYFLECAFTIDTPEGRRFSFHAQVVMADGQVLYLNAGKIAGDDERATPVELRLETVDDDHIRLASSVTVQRPQAAFRARTATFHETRTILLNQAKEVELTPAKSPWQIRAKVLVIEIKPKTDSNGMK